ncbi:MAG: leucyl/phenylalanyl-tRNA--protein transferase, partial [Rhodanobacter sp.]
ASKVALMALGQLLHEEGYPLLDTQVANPHTLGLGAIEVSRADYLAETRQLTAQAGRIGSWASLSPQLQQP